jgi:UDP-3-O-[3-hydroxymyristoyl] N-acetylglucosamine deacetylase/3-hydroxyacyl-[acyl-carrier-protein] dehydratase
VAFAKLIRAMMKRDRFKEKYPKYDPSIKPLMDVNEIQKLLPHRPPFLFIDKILELSDRHVVGLKQVTMNEWFFTGHFPGAPVMPASSRWKLWPNAAVCLS